MKITQKQIEAVTALPGPKRYEHFIKVVADSEQVWGLYQDGWALAATDDDKQVVLPLWPANEYAKLCGQKNWKGYEPKAIDLYEFMDTMIPDLNEKGIMPCIFYLPTDKGVIPRIEQLLADLKIELTQYDCDE